MSFTAFSQVQLDSIVVFDEEYLEESIQYNFTYDNGKLKTFEQEFENESWITAEIEYNSIGKMSVINQLFLGYPTVYELFYNDEDLLDTVMITDASGIDLMGTYIYENNVLTKFTNFQFDGGTAVEAFNKTYVYEGNVETVTLNSPFGNFAEDFVYDDEGRLTRWTEQLTASGLIDTFIYVDNCLKLANRKSSAGGDYSLAIEYSCDASLNFSEIPNPADYFIFIDYFVNDLAQHYYYPMLYGAKVDGSTGTYAFAEETSTWHYSLPTSTNERVAATPFSVYPNPTADVIVMELEQSLVLYTIYDMNGMIVMSKKMSQDQAISVAGLASGSYTIAANTKDAKYFFAQFVKE